MGILHFLAQDKNFEKINQVEKFYQRLFCQRRKARVRFSDEKQTYRFRITKGMSGFP
jgi:hypothetical protein